MKGARRLPSVGCLASHRFRYSGMLDWWASYHGNLGGIEMNPNTIIATAIAVAASALTVSGCGSPPPSALETCTQNYERCTSDATYYLSTHACERLTEPFRVTGTDIYSLDRNGNGVACETTELTTLEVNEQKKHKELVRQSREFGQDSGGYDPGGDEYGYDPECPKYCP